MDKQQTHHFCGFDIPVNLMLMTGGGPETFDIISQGHINNLEKYIGLSPDSCILEIGCGIGRDAIPLTKTLSANGSYLGVDIIGPSIKWCQEHITARYPNFRFVHFDVRDQLHNPRGMMSARRVTIPLTDGSVALIILQSVFTHLLRPEIQHYLAEFRRLLTPGGLVYATMFLYNDAILASARATNLTPFDLRFEHELEAGCRVNDRAYPTGAVAYSPEALHRMLQQASLKLVRPPLKGAWSGYYPEPEDGQDVAILGLDEMRRSPRGSIARFFGLH